MVTYPTFIVLYMVFSFGCPGYAARTRGPGPRWHQRRTCPPCSHATPTLYECRPLPHGASLRHVPIPPRAPAHRSLRDLLPPPPAAITPTLQCRTVQRLGCSEHWLASAYSRRPALAHTAAAFRLWLPPCGAPAHLCATTQASPRPPGYVRVRGLATALAPRSPRAGVFTRWRAPRACWRYLHPSCPPGYVRVRGPGYDSTHLDGPPSARGLRARGDAWDHGACHAIFAAAQPYA